jgi:hypothetical protein
LIFLLQSLLKKKLVKWNGEVGRRRAGGEGGCKKGDKAREGGGRREVKKKRERGMSLGQGFLIFHVTGYVKRERRGGERNREEGEGRRRRRAGRREKKGNSPTMATLLFGLILTFTSVKAFLFSLSPRATG